ncbi:MAG TPA: hypothetical protein PLN53_14010 [Terricaulis sp.]|nr:hypothetical protein [Terricaulis sp.]
MRRMFLAAIAAFALAGTACSRDDEGEQEASIRASTVVVPETRVDAVPHEEPAVARAQWRAVGDTARAVTGNLRVSIERTRGGPLIFAFATGVTIRAQPYNVVPADSRSGVGGQSYAALLGGDPRVDVYLYRVLSENVTTSAPQGGLCGGMRTRIMAVSEYVDSSGRWVFKIASFRGEGALGEGEDTILCNAFAYTAQ